MRSNAHSYRNHEEEVDVACAARAVCALLQDRAQLAKLELVDDIADDLPTVWADERRLKQIVFNLLSNAVKFTPTGGKITIYARCEADRGVTMEVRDTGIGIAEKDIPTALAPFSQVDSDLNRVYEGTGLGLPLTNALVGLHGGRLELESEVGTGTTVTVRLPASRTMPETVVDRAAG